MYEALNHLVTYIICQGYKIGRILAELGRIFQDWMAISISKQYYYLHHCCANQFAWWSMVETLSWSSMGKYQGIQFTYF